MNVCNGAVDTAGERWLRFPHLNCPHDVPSSLPVYSFASSFHTFSQLTHPRRYPHILKALLKMGAPSSRLRSAEPSGSDDFQDALVLMITTFRKHAANTYKSLIKDSNDTRSVLQASNDQIQRMLDQLKANSSRLQREISLLQRHIGTLKNPAFETWEADILTRLIEIAHAHQRIKLSQGVSIGEANSANGDALIHAYVNASRQVQENTLRQMGLGPKYGKALLRYHEVSSRLPRAWPTGVRCSHLTDSAKVVQYRSRNPFQTETQFARWLVSQRKQRPEKFAFWAKLFPICYGRTVEQSAALEVDQD